MGTCCAFGNSTSRGPFLFEPLCPPSRSYSTTTFMESLGYIGALSMIMGWWMEGGSRNLLPLPPLFPKDGSGRMARRERGGAKP